MTRQAADASRQAIYATRGFARYAGARADQLSGGTLAKLKLGLALLPDPPVLLLDEPYAGFDFATYQRFRTIVAGRRGAGRSVLIISHFVVDEQTSIASSTCSTERRCHDDHARPPVPGRLHPQPVNLLLLAIVPVVSSSSWPAAWPTPPHSSPAQAESPSRPPAPDGPPRSWPTSLCIFPDCRHPRCRPPGGHRRAGLLPVWWSRGCSQAWFLRSSPRHRAGGARRAYELNDSVRVAAGTLMFAMVYIAIGAVIGTLVRSTFNGTLAVLFIWILDVFFGPAMGAADRWATRQLPTHFITRWMLDLPSGHGGRLGDLGWGLLWTVAAISPPHRGHAYPPFPQPPSGPAGRCPYPAMGSVRGRLVGRAPRPGAVVLLVVVPRVFIRTAVAVTPDEPISL